MQMIEFDPVALRGAFVITPPPPDRNRRVEKISDITVGNRVVRTLPDPDSNCMRQQAPGTLDNAIVDSYTSSAHGLWHNGFFANAHTLDTEIKHPRMIN